jgi:hypothetical protein
MMTTPTHNDEALRFLIPDYLNGNLEPRQRAELEECLERDEHARQDLAFWRDVMNKMEQDKAKNIAIEPAGLQEFLAYTRAHPHAQAGADVRSWWRSLLDSGAAWIKPAIVFCTLVIAVQGVVIWRMTDYAAIDSGDQMRGLAPAHAVKTDMLTIAFKPEATEQSIRQALIGSSARIVDGPNGQLGDYRIAVPLGKAEEAATKLRASGLTLGVTIETKH